ncbi:hypothetical protein H4219_003055 [Mycoemilia scoparia]|uniref:Uncharacterized protein n=1 Tax=Mycoemilia scoparia TaxID=417184 RepID=A0A9W8A132_9FUNG|nr:hypothetical protein H4219_003055 [Mycoemilia scoparia]
MATPVNRGGDNHILRRQMTTVSDSGTFRAPTMDTDFSDFSESENPSPTPTDVTEVSFSNGSESGSSETSGSEIDPKSFGPGSRGLEASEAGKCQTACIAGVSVGAVVFVLVMTLFFIWLFKRHKKQKEERDILNVEKSLPLGPKPNNAVSILKSHKLPAPPPTSDSPAHSAVNVASSSTAHNNNFGNSNHQHSGPTAAPTTDSIDNPYDNNGTLPLLPPKDYETGSQHNAGARVAFN